MSWGVRALRVWLEGAQLEMHNWRGSQVDTDGVHAGGEESPASSVTSSMPMVQQWLRCALQGWAVTGCAPMVQSQAQARLPGNPHAHGYWLHVQVCSVQWLGCVARTGSRLSPTSAATGLASMVHWWPGCTLQGLVETGLVPSGQLWHECSIQLMCLSVVRGWAAPRPNLKSVCVP